MSNTYINMVRWQLKDIISTKKPYLLLLLHIIDTIIIVPTIIDKEWRTKEHINLIESEKPPIKNEQLGWLTQAGEKLLLLQ